MKSTRDRILQTLLTHPKSTIVDLAEAVEINAISVRHHLASLQAENLVVAEEERHGVGRPRLVYSLTEKGAEQFPTRYLNLIDRIIGQMGVTLSEEKVKDIFINIANDLSSEHVEKAKYLPLEKRLDYLTEVLASEGFTVRWEKEANGYMVNIITCPYYHLSQNHPEVCLVDETLISGILFKPLEKVKDISDGSTHCSYFISHNREAE